jgi:hypothetical protein
MKMFANGLRDSAFIHRPFYNLSVLTPKIGKYFYSKGEVGDVNYKHLVN